MKQRLEAELKLLREYYPDLEYKEERGHWIKLPNHKLPEGWNHNEIPVAFEMKDAYPGTPPYGIYAPADLTFRGHAPNNANTSPPQPPFEGKWILLSWSPADGQWKPTADLRTGSNLFQWVRGFGKRFAEGQ